MAQAPAETADVLFSLEFLDKERAIVGGALFTAPSHQEASTLATKLVRLDTPIDATSWRLHDGIQEVGHGLILKGTC
jgi:hypothetical protein